MDNIVNLSVILFIILASAWEWSAGRNSNGKKSREDWGMAFIAAFGLSAIQRPALIFAIAGLGAIVAPHFQGSLSWLEDAYFWPVLIAYIFIEELLHSGAHFFSHARRPRWKPLLVLQQLYKIGHRPHHFSGKNDGRGELSVTQTFVEHWLFWFIMPNFWFQFICLYLGLTEVFLIGTVFKGLWAAHNHVNWNYDLYFLNHRWSWVRKTMRGLCHVITFPTQHHHHHARGKNSVKNMSNLLALYDWLLFGTLAIETERPKQYGWKQSPQEEHSVWYRYFAIDTKKLGY
ncbi:sterol desaturase [Zhongshania borealis]|uniref:Sterol desaturase n=1 Tax=Zhongshania borealis TaxID=889488 RepID=A0ABP7WVC8_9GAMM